MIEEKKLFRAILIDPELKTITEVEIDERASLDSIYALLGVKTITSVRASQRDFLFLDDEGFLKQGVPVFRMKNYGNPLAGRGLIIGVDETGESVATTMSLATVAGFVQWTDEESTGSLTPSYETPGVFHIGDPITRKKTH